ncbi:division/cell wall cluster transcriptional repressor MraZ [Vallitalea guaymasensis]|uniref:Transcriptional regulator MraZ n=1 Tax=Vallitalea guaymasensis TaxID=1185412 RepID=A0A8J8MFD7_9FIRM|nr:division/cell wall cluster transcriptional repressor MraZ [Vallitalea guaymasensis]QUH32099.1 division/cell wall cluster transcriptional repressor MraZ [Vallitalea guaymasensis]
MFIGEYKHSIDDKGRLIVPAKFRALLGETFYLTKGFDNCLMVYTEEEWNKFIEKLNNNPMKKKDARRIQRFFIASANECNLDKQGRILIPSHLREYSVLEKEVILIGVSNRVEIWSKENWEDYNADEDIDISELAEDMEDLDI